MSFDIFHGWVGVSLIMCFNVFFFNILGVLKSGLSGEFNFILCSFFGFCLMIYLGWDKDKENKILNELCKT